MTSFRNISWTYLLLFVSHCKLLSSLTWITAIISFLVLHFWSYPFQSISFTINSPGYSLPLLKFLQRLSTAVRKMFKFIIIASKPLWLDLCLAFRFLLSCSPPNSVRFWHTGLLTQPLDGASSSHHKSYVYAWKLLPTIPLPHHILFISFIILISLILKISLVFWMCSSFSH